MEQQDSNRFVRSGELFLGFIIDLFWRATNNFVSRIPLARIVQKSSNQAGHVDMKHKRADSKCDSNDFQFEYYCREFEKREREQSLDVEVK